eukprot:176878_1
MGNLMGTSTTATNQDKPNTSNSNSSDNKNEQKDQNDASSTSKKKPAGKNKIELAASVLGGAAMFTAYHTSILINGREYFFDMGGIMKTDNLLSHKGKQQFKRIELGYTNKSGSGLERTLRRHFEGGTYDLLRKNCNSFSDCALWYLLRQRIPSTYTRMESIGKSEMLGSLMQNGEYKPNPKADGFDKEKVIEECKDIFEKTSGLQLGGQNVENKDDMKAKRLAMLEKRMMGTK